MNILFYDTETDGLPKGGIYPHIVQIAAILDDGSEELETLCEIIKPNGFEIPEEASAIHGISTERALKEGKDLKMILSRFLAMAERADLIVCHNIGFDMPVVSQELERVGLSEEALEDKEIFCTMLASTDICQIKFASNQRRPGYKWPKLIEAHQYFFKEGFDDAHDALADVRACRRVYHELKRRNFT